MSRLSMRGSIISVPFPSFFKPWKTRQIMLRYQYFLWSDIFFLFFSRRYMSSLSMRGSIRSAPFPSLYMHRKHKIYSSRLSIAMVEIFKKRILRIMQPPFLFHSNLLTRHAQKTAIKHHIQVYFYTCYDLTKNIQAFDLYKGEKASSISSQFHTFEAKRM